MSASQDVIDAHGPPLTGVSTDTGSVYPLSIDDDRGAFIYIPLIGYALGTHDLDALMKWVFISFFVPLLLVYPRLLYELTGSLIAAVVAPPILLSHSTFLRTSGIFWMPAWANLFLLPLLLLIAVRWKRSSVWLLVLLAIVASVASSVRANAGLGFVLGALLLVFVRMPRWRLRLISAGVIVLAYLSIGTFAMHAVQLQRDDVVGRDFTSPYPNAHPFWHNAYMGLGYLKNPYGIRLQDPIAAAAAQKQDPGAVFPTRRYERALRALYFRVLSRHPGFVLHEYAVKAGLVVSWALSWFPAAVLLIPFLLLFGKRRRPRQFQFLLMLGAGIVGAASGIIVDPRATAQNLSGWYGFLLLLWLLSIGWLARLAEPAIARLALNVSARQTFVRATPSAPVSLRLARRHVLRLVRVLRTRVPGLIESEYRRVTRAAHSRWRARSDLRWRFLARSAIPVVVVSAALIANSSGNSNAAAGSYWAAQATLVPRNAHRGPTVAEWRLGRGVPSGWSLAARRVAPSSGQLRLWTTGGKYSHQLKSPASTLEPGSYVFLVDGRVIRGGLRLAVIDERSNTAIASSVYWWDQPYPKARLMVVTFELARLTNVSFVFAKFSPFDADSSSLWSLRSVTLIRQRGGCRLNDPFAYFTGSTGPVQP
jgi:hypothetical protein